MFRKILSLLTARERKRLTLLAVIMLISAAYDAFGVLSIIPVILVLSNPEAIESIALLNHFFTISKTFGISTQKEFQLLLIAIFLGFLVTGLFLKALTLYAQNRFALMRQFSLGVRAMEGYLRQPYSWFLSRNSADLGKTILAEVNSLVSGAIMPLLELISHGAIISLILIVLTAIDPILALSIFGWLAVAYGAIFVLARGRLTRLGEERFEANKLRFRAISEAFGAVKEVKVAGLESVYVTRFSIPTKLFATGQALANAITVVPRYLMEAVTFGGMLLIVFFLIQRDGSFMAALPVVGLYAYAGYRLMPSLQKIYQEATKVSFFRPAFEAIFDDLSSLRSVEVPLVSPKPMGLTRYIELHDVAYTYPTADSPALTSIDLSIAARTTVGIVGVTGSGKTTMVDVILGILEPRQGVLRVDDQIIDDSNRRAWQCSIGYVPQQIYLADDTVTANIAFGVINQEVDHAAVQRAAKVACLHDFVVNNLADQYESKVGDHGVRLSGGQRQRIGIARAIYHNPDVLVLDEATSALDNLTEQAIMDAMQNLRQKMTIIVIAHRLRTIENCDQIYFLDNGRIAGQGSFEELAKQNSSFAAMAKAR